MAAIILTLLFAIQACIGKSVNNKCCESKTVGEFNYTLVNTPVDFPEKCLDSCAYTRDDLSGSVFCFMKGDEPVTCTEFCFPGPPGPTGCPPVDNLKITDYPNTLGNRPSSQDCWDFCRALCPVVGLLCQCYAWTYNTEDKMCSTFNSLPACYGTIQEEGWISGAPCHESNATPIKEIANIPGDFKEQPKQYGPFGDLPGQTTPFIDEPNDQPINEIKMWTGDVNGFKDVIVGIEFNYGEGVTPQPRGNTTGTAKQTCTIQQGTFFTNITVRSTISTSNPQSSLVYYLDFLSTDQNMKPQTCDAGNPGLGTATSITITEENPQLSFIKGKVTAAKPTLASLTFVYNAK